MNTALWIVQIVLTIAFAVAGTLKLSQPRDKLAENMGWVEDYSAGFVKVVGAVEILGALGLILPGVTGIAPMLTPLAATGLALEQVGAAAVHARRGEPQFIIGNIVLIAAAAFVAWGRFGDYSL